MTDRTTAPTTRRFSLGPLWLQVLVGIVLGIAIGIFFPHTAVALKPFSDGFIKLIRMTLAPIIFATVVVGIARMGDLKEVGRVGAKALIYFEIFSTIALLLGVVAADVLHPGRGMNIDAATLDASSISTYTASAQQTGVVSFLLNIIPSSAGEPFVSGNILQIILIGVLFGMALAQFRAAAVGIFQPRHIRLNPRGIDDQQKVRGIETVRIQIIHHPAPLIAHQGVLALAGRQFPNIIGERPV